MRGTIDLTVGARPNFMKLAPVDRALRALVGDRIRIVHTGQHYDDAMSRTFFADLGIPLPDVDLEIGPGPQGAQTARILERYEAVLTEHRPLATVVFGDVNSTLACALAASKLHVPVVHVEAGLRSFDRTMPEETNRVLTDAISDLLLVSEAVGVENLRREGVPENRIRLIGNTMVDTLRACRAEAAGRRAAFALGLEPDRYALLTLHRPANVDDPETLGRIVDVLVGLAGELPFVFPVHPRTRRALERAGLTDRLAAAHAVHLLEPQPYLDTLSLLLDAAVAVTDSGGLQAEAACVGTPCITLRDATEHVATVAAGANRLAGTDPLRIRAAFDEAVGGSWPEAGAIPLWDGRAGERAARAILEFVEGRPDE